MSGILTIHSSGDGSLLSGHSWIEYQQDGGEDHTYGTWGNNPLGLGNGLHEDLEKGRTGDATRSIHITDDQEKKLFQTIDDYRKKGADGWEYLNPCSAFAADAWHAATGENLASRSYFVISNPSKLKESILDADRLKPEPDGRRLDILTRPSGSSRLAKAACVPCSKTG
jgi:hypothetical protein